jgi:hypothetical protein
MVTIVPGRRAGSVTSGGRRRRGGVARAPRRGTDMQLQHARTLTDAVGGHETTMSIHAMTTNHVGSSAVVERVEMTYPGAETVVLFEVSCDGCSFHIGWLTEQEAHATAASHHCRPPIATARAA